MALVLDCNTGLASPQFHVAFDPTFDTVKDIATESKWQIRAGFVAQRELLTTPRSTTTAASLGTTSTASKTCRGKKRKRNETATEQQQTREPLETEPRPAAANVGDGGQPTPPNESETQKEAEIDMVETTTQSGRKKAKTAPRLIEALTSEILARATASDIEGEIFCYARTMFPDDDAFDCDDPFLAYKTVSDPDTLYFHQAMKEPDSKEFMASMMKEVQDQFNNGNFNVVHRSKVPAEQTILPAVWQMRRKRDAKTGAIKMNKACMNIDGSRMQKGEHYDMTYSPVASWNSI